MKKCVCGSENFITLESQLIRSCPDSEPYENGVKEEITEEDDEYLDQMEDEINITVCRKCRAHFYYINGMNI